MKKILFVIVISLISFSAIAQSQRSRNNETFLNPVFAGDYPDPSILRDGDDFYLVHSSFEYYPGLLVWHSTDLINWLPLSNALHKYVGSVWAPDLVKYDGRYYIYFPASNKNYVVTADNIEGPWSEPVLLDIELIDPGHVVDEIGNRYLYFNNGSYVPLSKDGLSITGDIQHSYDGWIIPRDWTIECFCMEGPKLFRRGDYYYLTVAQGGTAGPPTGHMVISARSKSPLGPWENSPYNPILRTQSVDEQWWSVGHATIFDDSNDEWYMIFHGFENGFYHMGRQTMLTPLEWTKDGWYKIPDATEIDKPIAIPQLDNKHTEEFNLSDPFNATELKSQWKFYKESGDTRYTCSSDGFVMNGKGNDVSNCSPLLTIPSDHSYTVDVKLEIEGNAIGGLVLFYNERAYSGILADKNSILANLRGWQFVSEKNAISQHVHLRLNNTNNIVDMYYSLDGKEWFKIENSFDCSAYHHNVLSGFMSLRIGLCSIGQGKVKFKNYEYHPHK
ncbi:family 43 glycosylhydrolase [Carboxylicivirga sp. N1Y90]|uniref:family 43 glycosylhydrolase n=1 Tax=Carboxylicivirga fragile TaxID=3417571 RepID=UPI003D3454BB|nr:family 43 glycosylhydrolase [Marinilabiliaceae bacterium N1Y90]